MEKRFYFDYERNQFSSVKVGDFFMDGDPTNRKVYIYMRVEEIIKDGRILCNAVNLETGKTLTWLDDDKVYPVESAEIEVKV